MTTNPPRMYRGMFETDWSHNGKPPVANLRGLDLNNNPLEEPLLEVAENGIDSIRDYFSQLDAEC